MVTLVVEKEAIDGKIAEEPQEIMEANIDRALGLVMPPK